MSKRIYALILTNGENYSGLTLTDDDYDPIRHLEAIRNVSLNGNYWLRFDNGQFLARAVVGIQHTWTYSDEEAQR